VNKGSNTELKLAGSGGGVLEGSLLHATPPGYSLKFRPLKNEWDAMEAPFMSGILFKPEALQFTFFYSFFDFVYIRGRGAILLNCIVHVN
jgi:hypothetical protein